ncbi:glycosyltransferase [Noviherbaspirillum sp. 1P10PC]|uniref:glycosyltransferase family 2 protein n=1 Tax=Noviherbaspirillum sp. 1P10PC TaxID=3132292 RepID=UPI0039A0CC83
MEISVVVCTRNRANYLDRMLISLQQLQVPDGLEWEIIFVNNGSSDNTRPVLESSQKRFSVPVKIIDEDRPGLSYARNVGWKEASGRIIAFTDDDCYPHSDWLAQIHQVLGDPHVGYVGGRVLLFDLTDAPVTIQISELTKDFPKGSHIESGNIIGANMAFKRQLLDQVQGFDCRLGAGTRLRAGEDTDLLIRASLAGFEGRYDPSIIVYHHHRRKPGADIHKLSSGYAYGRGALSMKTILESDAKSLYLKNWYWRIRSLIAKKRFLECLEEARGAVLFLSESRKSKSSAFTKAG